MQSGRRSLGDELVTRLRPTVSLSQPVHSPSRGAHCTTRAIMASIGSLHTNLPPLTISIFLAARCLPGGFLVVVASAALFGSCQGYGS